LPNENNGLSDSALMYLADDCQLISNSACADSTRPTQRCVLFNFHTTPSVIGVLQLLDHTRETRCSRNYKTVTVSASLNDLFGDHGAL